MSDKVINEKAVRSNGLLFCFIVRFHFLSKGDEGVLFTDEKYQKSSKEGSSPSFANYLAPRRVSRRKQCAASMCYI